MIATQDSYSLVLNRVSLRIKQRSPGGIEDGSGFRLLEAQVSKSASTGKSGDGVVG